MKRKYIGNAGRPINMYNFNPFAVCAITDVNFSYHLSVMFKVEIYVKVAELGIKVLARQSESRR